MAAREEKINDFYAVLGLKKECSATELRTAYKKLALVRYKAIYCSFVVVLVILGTQIA